jgi:hypothetical protein
LLVFSRGAEFRGMEGEDRYPGKMLETGELRGKAEKQDHEKGTGTAMRGLHDHLGEQIIFAHGS